MIANNPKYAIINNPPTRIEVAKAKVSVTEKEVDAKTLKTGDLLFVATPIDTQVSVGEQISVKFNEIEPLNFSIK